MICQHGGAIPPFRGVYPESGEEAYKVVNQDKHIVNRQAAAWYNMAISSASSDSVGLTSFGPKASLEAALTATAGGIVAFLGDAPSFIWYHFSPGFRDYTLQNSSEGYAWNFRKDPVPSVT
jgi:hypothetical protein